MKITVCVKQVSILPGPAVLLGDGSGIDPLFALRRINDPDENAVEEALRICEAHGGGEVVVMTVGSDTATEVLRKCISVGAHRAIRVWGAAVQLHDPLSIARALAQAARRESPDLILCGVQSTDVSQQATGTALASAMGVPCITIAKKIEVSGPGDSAIVHRETEGGGTEVVEVDLPALITVQTGLNVPRLPSFKAVMMAKRASIACFDPGNSARSRIQVLGLVVNTPTRSQLQMMAGGPSDVAAKIATLVRGSK